MKRLPVKSFLVESSISLVPLGPWALPELEVPSSFKNIYPSDITNTNLKTLILGPQFWR